MTIPWSSFFTQLINAFLLQPLNLLLVALVGLLVARWHSRIGKTLLIGSLALLWLCATPYFAGNAMGRLQSLAKAVDTQAQPADAIIVLSGGTYSSVKAPEYGADTDSVSGLTLVRLRYTAKLERETGRPILVTGGKRPGNDLPDALVMKAVLEKEFKVPVRWTEDSSNNTLESARYSYQQLQEHGIKRVYLVTHAWHMRRSVMAFESAGFEVVPAPTAFALQDTTSLMALFPRDYALINSSIAMREFIGLLWYSLQTRI